MHGRAGEQITDRNTPIRLVDVQLVAIPTILVPLSLWR